MVSIDIWHTGKSAGIAGFDKYFNKFTEKRTRYFTPVLHSDWAILDKSHLVKISQTIIEKRETPNLQIIIIADDDYRRSDGFWLTNSIQTICGVADFCPGTVIILISILSENSQHLIECRERLRQIIDTFRQHIFVDFDKKLEQTDYGLNQYLTEIGVRKLRKLLLNRILALPMINFLG